MAQPAFADRAEAGRRLAAELFKLEHPIVLGLPRGGVPVAAAVANVIGAPLDVFVVRKLGLPAQPELAMGAVASGGVRILNDDVLREASVPAEVLEEVTARAVSLGLSVTDLFGRSTPVAAKQAAPAKSAGASPGGCRRRAPRATTERGRRTGP